MDLHLRYAITELSFYPHTEEPWDSRTVPSYWQDTMQKEANKSQKQKKYRYQPKLKKKKREDNWIPVKRRSRSRQVKELMELVLTQEEPLLLCRHYFVKQSWTPWQDREEVSITQSDSQEEEGPCADKSLEKYDVSRMPSQANK